MLNEIYEGLYGRCGGRLELSVAGVSQAGKTAFIRSFGRFALPTAEADESGTFSGTIPIGEKKFFLSLSECTATDWNGQAAVLVVSDGSFSAARAESVQQEEMYVQSLKNSGKPFVILLNSSAPQSEECQFLLSALREKYAVPIVAADCLNGNDFEEMLSLLLLSFPVVRMDFILPEWVRVLPQESKIVSETIARIREVSSEIVTMRDCNRLEKALSDGDFCFESYDADVSCGTVSCYLAAKEGLYYQVLSEECGTDISDELNLMSYVRTLKESKQFYERYGAAFRAADECGYGISSPSESEMQLLSPELVRRGTKCGVRLQAEACTYHIIKVEVHNEVSPIAGETARSEEIAEGMIETYKKDPQALWNTDMFGKTLKEMVQEGFSEKTVPQEVRSKLQKAITRIVNEGKGGVLCVLL